MNSPIIVESKLNEAIRAMPAGFRLAPGKFGDERCGCMIGAFALYVNDRKVGESALQVACRHFGVDKSYFWAAVAGFDGKQPTSEVKIQKGLYEEWYEMGIRMASTWKVHEKTM